MNSSAKAPNFRDLSPRHVLTSDLQVESIIIDCRNSVTTCQRKLVAEKGMTVAVRVWSN